MSGQKANLTLAVAHGVGLPITLNSEGRAPDWIMVLPAGSAGALTTVDGRGPYRLNDASKLVAASLQAAGGRLPIDENHATDLAAPRGEPSPARGWMTGFEVRPEGTFARVEWNPAGAALMAEKAYRFISPVFTADGANNVARLLRASLTNTPNLRGMIALHSQETNMDLLATLRKVLGLADDADEAAVLAKVRAMSGGSTALQSIAEAAGLAKDATGEVVLNTVKTLKSNTALQSIAKAAGLKDDADAPAIVAAVTTLASGSGDADKRIVALQSELTTLATSFNALSETTKKEKAIAFVDAAIAAGRIGVKPQRDHYIALHSENPANAEKIINALPELKNGSIVPNDPPKDGKIALNAEHLNAAKILGISAEDYRKTLEAEQTAA